MTRLADTILAADRARATARTEQEAEHARRHDAAVAALRDAVGPDADPGPVNGLASALGVDADAVRTVLRAGVFAPEVRP